MFSDYDLTNKKTQAGLAREVPTCLQVLSHLITRRHLLLAKSKSTECEKDLKVKDQDGINER
jgi:hypothetical protein